MIVLVCSGENSECRTAGRWLDARGVEYIKRDIASEGPTSDELKQWQQTSGLPISRFFDIGGLLFKALELRALVPLLVSDEQLRLLASDRLLVKNPILVTDDGACPGFKEEDWAQLILNEHRAQ